MNELMGSGQHIVGFLTPFTLLLCVQQGEREKVEVCFSLHHWLLYHFFQSDHGTAAAVCLMKYAGVLC